MQTLKCFQMRLNSKIVLEKEQEISSKAIRLVQEVINKSPKRNKIIRILERRDPVPVEPYVEEG